MTSAKCCYQFCHVTNLVLLTGLLNHVFLSGLKATQPIRSAKLPLPIGHKTTSIQPVSNTKVPSGTKSTISKGQVQQGSELPRVPRKSTVLTTILSRTIIRKLSAPSVPLKVQWSSREVDRRFADRAEVTKKAKWVPFKLRDCKLCKITCNSSMTFFVHNSRKISREKG